MKKTILLLTTLASFAFSACSDPKLRQAAEMSGNEMAVAFYDFNHANMTDTWLNGPEVENWIKSYAVAKGYTDSVNVTEFITIAKAQLHKALNTLTGDHDLTPPTGRFALYPNERDSADIVNGKIR